MRKKDDILSMWLEKKKNGTGRKGGDYEKMDFGLKLGSAL